MDSKTVSQFFELIRSGLWQHDADASLFGADTDWQLLYRMAVMQSMTVIFADGADTLPASLIPPTGTARRLHLALLGTLGASDRLESAISEMVTILRNAGIEGVLLKGQGVARYYAVPGHRMCGDIDFYVGRQAHTNACRMLEQKGMRLLEDSSKHSSFELNGAIIELHRMAAFEHSPIRNRLLNAWADGLLGNSDSLRKESFKGTTVYLPPARFDLVFLLYHASHHMITGGIGLRQLCDWCRCLHANRGTVNLPELESDIRKLGLWKTWGIFAWIAVNRLGLPEDEMPFYSPSFRKTGIRCLGLILEEGNFGRYSDKRAKTRSRHRIIRKLQSCRQVLCRQARILSIMPGQSLRFTPGYLIDGVARAITGR